MAKNIGTLGKYDQRRLWKLICMVNNFLSFDSLEISLWNKCFFSNTRWTQLLAPLEIIMSKISQIKKYQKTEALNVFL